MENGEGRMVDKYSNCAGGLQSNSNSEWIFRP